MTVLFNPEIHPLGDAVSEDWEGCLSLPGLRGRVRRPDRVRLVAADLSGERSERILAGTHARIVQHECDHLDGRLYPSRMHDPASLAYLDELVTAGLLAPPRRVSPGSFVGPRLLERPRAWDMPPVLPGRTPAGHRRRRTSSRAHFPVRAASGLCWNHRRRQAVPPSGRGVCTTRKRLGPG